MECHEVGPGPGAQPDGGGQLAHCESGAVLCVRALEDALERYGAPLVSNTDQGRQFTSEAYLRPLRAAGVRISMDGRGRWIDNRFIERLWRSLKYEAV